MDDDIELLLIEATLRDSRHMDVIMALDRLVILPTNEAGLQQAMTDLERVKKFISEHLPEPLKPRAKEMFVEHGRKIESAYRAAKNKGGGK